MKKTPDVEKRCWVYGDGIYLNLTPTKPKAKQLWNDLTEDEILQLSDNLSEGLPCGNVRDWRAVAKYWRDQHDRLVRLAWSMRGKVMRMALDMERECEIGAK